MQFDPFALCQIYILLAYGRNDDEHSHCAFINLVFGGGIFYRYFHTSFSIDIIIGHIYANQMDRADISGVRLTAATIKYMSGILLAYLPANKLFWPF